MNGKTNTTVVTNIIEGVQVPLEAPTNLSLTPLNARVDITWTDPVDKYAAPNGQTAANPWDNVATWDHSIIVRKAGSAPTGPEDGELIYTETVRNQHQYTAYSDTNNVINNTLYYYAVFAITQLGTISESISDSCTPIEGTPKFNKAIAINENMFRPIASAAVTGHAIYVCENFAGAYNEELTEESLSSYYFTRNDSSAIGELSSDSYAMFAGGIERGYGSNPIMNEYSETVAYDQSLTAYTSGTLKNAYAPAIGKSFKGYMIFAGGYYYSYTSAYGSSSVNYTDAFDESFTNISTMPLLETYSKGGNGVTNTAAATTSDYLLIAGGYSHKTTSATSSQSTYVDNVEVFDSSLTKIRSGEIKLSCAKSPYVGLSIDGKGVFFGGSGDSIDNLAVEVFDNALTRSVATSLPYAVRSSCGDILGSYAMMVGSSYSDGPVMYDSSLTQVTKFGNKLDEFDGNYPTRETVYQISDSTGFISTYDNGGNWNCHIEVFNIV